MRIREVLAMNEDDLEYDDIEDDEPDDEQDYRDTLPSADDAKPNEKKPYQGHLRPMGGDQPGSGATRPLFGSNPFAGGRSASPSDNNNQSPLRSGSSPFGARPTQPPSGSSPFGSGSSGSASPFGARPTQPPSGKSPLGSSGSGSLPQFAARPTQPPSGNSPLGSGGKAFGGLQANLPMDDIPALSELHDDDDDDLTQLKLSTSSLGKFSIRRSTLPKKPKHPLWRRVLNIVLGVCLIAVSSGLLAVKWSLEVEVIAQWFVWVMEWLQTWGAVIIPSIGLLLGLSLVLQQFNNE